MSANLITVSDTAAVSVEVLPSAYEERDRLMAIARRGGKVDSAESAARAAEVLKSIKAFTRAIEEGRKSAKAPVRRLAERIDDTASALVIHLEQEADRIGRLIGAWEAEQEKARQEAKRAAWEEEQRLRRAQQERDRAEAARLAAEQAERDRVAAAEREKLAAAQERARSDKRKAELAAQQQALEQEQAKAKAEAEAKAKAEGLKRDEELATKIGQAHSQAVAVVAPKVDGIAKRRDVEFEVFDIVALYESAPYLVTLTPNKTAIKGALKNLPEGQSLPGVRHSYSTRAIVR